MNPAKAGLGEITFPFDLAAQSTNGSLSVDLNEETKRSLYGILFCPQASTTHRASQ